MNIGEKYTTSASLPELNLSHTTSASPPEAQLIAYYLREPPREFNLSNIGTHSMVHESGPRVGSTRQAKNLRTSIKHKMNYDFCRRFSETE